MRECVNKKKAGIGLAELMVTMAVISIVILGSYQIFDEGIKLFNTNVAASDAQAAALKVQGRVSLESSNAKARFTQNWEAPANLPGIVFASPIDDNGNAEFDALGNLVWKKLVCFYFQSPGANLKGKIYRAEENINGTVGTTDSTVVESLVKGTTRSTDYFAATGGIQRSLISDQVSNFSVTPYVGDIDTAAAPVAVTSTAYNVVVEAGLPGQLGSNAYYIRIDSIISPRG